MRLIWRQGLAPRIAVIVGPCTVAQSTAGGIPFWKLRFRLSSVSGVVVNESLKALEVQRPSLWMFSSSMLWLAASLAAPLRKRWSEYLASGRLAAAMHYFWLWTTALREDAEDRGLMKGALGRLWSCMNSILNAATGLYAHP